MKLSRLYCSDPRFKEVVFSDALNLVIAQIHHPDKFEKNSHNLGKSTLAELIDFMLLKEIKKEHFLKKNADLLNHIFYLEIHLNSGRFLTIRRAIKNNTKILFLDSENSHKSMESDYENLENHTIDSAKILLNRKINFDVLTQYSYRNASSYFIRTQNDFIDVFELAKHNKGKDANWKPQLLTLLGFDPTLLIKKYEYDKNINELKTLKNASAPDTEEINKLQSLLEINQNKKIELDNQLNRFDFYMLEKNLNHDLIENIEVEIAELNTKAYRDNYELEKSNKSISNIKHFDLEALQSIYNEVQIHFPDHLMKNYQELVQFNTEIYAERNGYLKKNINRLKLSLIETNKKLKDLNSQRMEILSFLGGTDTFEKFKQYQFQLTDVISKIAVFEDGIKNLNKAEEYQTQINQLTSEMTNQLKPQLSTIIFQSNNDFQNIKLLFNQFYERIFNATATLFLTVNDKANITFHSEIEDGAQSTAQDKGNSYKKMLCICFDLAIICHYSDRSFFKFIYHDGCLEGLDNRKKENFYQLIKELIELYNIQYIFSGIEDDIPLTILNDIKPESKCLILSDENDQGKLFGFSF